MDFKQAVSELDKRGYMRRSTRSAIKRYLQCVTFNAKNECAETLQTAQRAREECDRVAKESESLTQQAHALQERLRRASVDGFGGLVMDAAQQDASSFDTDSTFDDELSDEVASALQRCEELAPEPLQQHLNALRALCERAGILPADHATREALSESILSESISPEEKGANEIMKALRVVKHRCRDAQPDVIDGLEVLVTTLRQHVSFLRDFPERAIVVKSSDAAPSQADVDRLGLDRNTDESLEDYLSRIDHGASLAEIEALADKVDVLDTEGYFQDIPNFDYSAAAEACYFDKEKAQLEVTITVKGPRDQRGTIEQEAVLYAPSRLFGRRVVVRYNDFTRS